MIIIGVAGGSGSGKTTFARALVAALKKRFISVAILEQDCYYRDQSASFDHDGGKVNFDHPDAIDWDLLVSHLKAIKSGQPIECPVYDFKTHKRQYEFVTIEPVEYLILDGILILVPEQLRDELDYKVFIHTREETRFQRRLERDVTERGRTPEGVRTQFEAQVKPMHDQYVEPSREFADYVVSEANGATDFSEEVRNVLSKISKNSN